MPQFYLQPQDKPRSAVRRAVYAAVGLFAAIILTIVLARIATAPKRDLTSILEHVVPPTTLAVPKESANDKAKREALARLERQAANPTTNPFGGAK